MHQTFLVINRATITWWCTCNDNRHYGPFLQWQESGLIGITTLKSRFTFNFSFYYTHQCHRLTCTLKKNDNLFAKIIKSCQSDVVRGHHFVAIPLYHCRTPSHHCRNPSHHSGTSYYIRTLWRIVTAHFVAPYPPHFSAPHSHIVTHQIRTFRRTVPAHFVAPYHVG